MEAETVYIWLYSLVHIGAAAFRWGLGVVLLIILCINPVWDGLIIARLPVMEIFPQP